MGLFKIKNITVLALFFVSFEAFSGGGWTQAKGEGYFKLSEWWSIADQHFTDQGKLDPNVTTALFNTNFYGEYGISNRFTGVVFAPLFSRSLMNNLKSSVNDAVLAEGDAINSIGDIDVALKYGILKNTKFVLSGTVLFGLPTGVSSGGKLGNLQTGDGEFNQMLRFDLSKGAYKKFSNGFGLTHYFSLYSGLNNRTNNFSDEFRYGGELGFGLMSNQLWLIGRLDGLTSLKNGATADMVTSTSVFANNAEYLAYSVEVAYETKKHWGVSASFASVFQGKIIMAAPAYTVGVFFNLKKKAQKTSAK